MRYFVRFVSGPLIMGDERGLLHPNLDPAQAREEMLRALEELLHEDAQAAEAWTGWQMELADASGEVLFSIALDEVLQLRPRSIAAE